MGSDLWSACILYLPLGAEGPDGFLRESEEGGSGAQQKDGGAQARVHRKEHQPEVGSQARPQEGDEACNMLQGKRFKSYNLIKRVLAHKLLVLWDAWTLDR
jgi:hypothetical protein